MLIVGKEATRPFGGRQGHQYDLREVPLPPPPDKKELKNLFFVPLDTKLQGTKLLDEKSLDAAKFVKQFIARRLIKAEEAKSYKWVRLRKDPYVAEKGE